MKFLVNTASNCDSQKPLPTIEINTLEELVAFIKEVNDPILIKLSGITNTWLEVEKNTIIIADDYLD